MGGSAVEKPDVRIIAATNRNLNERVEKGQMREDFFYRIHIIPIYMPPLRDRREDIPLLVEHFMKKHRGKEAMPTLPGSILASLTDHDWPGNVRELENTIQRFVNLGHIDFFGCIGPIGPCGR